MKNRHVTISIGNRISFRGVIYNLTGLDGDVALLTVPGEPPVAIRVTSLFADQSFEILDAIPLHRRITGPSRLFDSLPVEVQQTARWWESHITEVLDGVPCDAAPGQVPRRNYDARLRSLRQRELAKHAELLKLGEDLSFSKLQRLVRAYLKQGVLGLVDQRLIRQVPIAGQTDQRVLDAILRVLSENTQQSSGTTDRLMRQVRKQLEAEHGAGAVPMPSTSTFHRLVGRMAEGRHATGSARTRRTLAQQPTGPFGAVYPVRPGGTDAD